MAYRYRLSAGITSRRGNDPRHALLYTHCLSPLSRTNLYRFLGEHSDAAFLLEGCRLHHIRGQWSSSRGDHSVSASRILRANGRLPLVAEIDFLDFYAIYSKVHQELY